MHRQHRRPAGRPSRSKREGLDMGRGRLGWIFALAALFTALFAGQAQALSLVPPKPDVLLGVSDRGTTEDFDEFEALTGVPVLINTSFNVKGEPIIETPRDAVICFLTTGIDHLVMHDMLVSKNAMHKVIAPLVNTYTDVATLVMSNIKTA